MKLPHPGRDFGTSLAVDVGMPTLHCFYYDFGMEFGMSFVDLLMETMYICVF